MLALPKSLNRTPHSFFKSNARFLFLVIILPLLVSVLPPALVYISILYNYLENTPALEFER